MGTPPNDLQQRLCTAARDGLVENIWALVKEGVDVDRYGTDGLTALHYAAFYGNVETVRVLLELGGNNALAPYVAIEEQRRLQQGFATGVQVEMWGDLRAQGVDGRYICGTTLHMAASRGHVKILRLLVRMGSDALVRDANGGTPLHDAAAGGYVETVRRWGATCMHRMQMGTHRRYIMLRPVGTQTQ